MPFMTYSSTRSGVKPSGRVVKTTPSSVDTNRFLVADTGSACGPETWTPVGTARR
jgi:hypothetical protein